MITCTESGHHAWHKIHCNLKQNIACYCHLQYVLFINRPPLRQYLMDGEFFVGAAVACTLTKLALRYLDMEGENEKQNVGIKVQWFLIKGPFVLDDNDNDSD